MYFNMIRVLEDKNYELQSFTKSATAAPSTTEYYDFVRLSNLLFEIKGLTNVGPFLLTNL